MAALTIVALFFVAEFILGTLLGRYLRGPIPPRKSDPIRRA